MKPESITCVPVVTEYGVVSHYQWRIGVNCINTDQWVLEKHLARHLIVEVNKDFEIWNFSLSYSASIELMCKIGRAVANTKSGGFKLTSWEATPSTTAESCDEVLVKSIVL